MRIRVLLPLLGLAFFSLASGCKTSDPKAKKTDKARPTIVPVTNLETFFVQEFAHSIKLDLDEDAMQALRDKPRNYVKGTMSFGRATYPVSVKLKGHRSFRKIDEKPAIKIRFGQEAPEGNFFGLKRLTLNNMVDDPTRMRESLGYHMYRRAGVPAPRTAYAFLNLNDEDLGIYLAVEPIDEVFVATHFSEPIGGLYEAEYGCDFYPSDIKGLERDGGPKKSREALEAVAKLAEESPSTLLRSDSPYIDFDSVISYLAMSTLLGDFDGYWHSHNYYVYQNGEQGKWLLLPWGIDRIFNDKLNIYGSHGRLAEICFAEKSCRNAYNKRLLELATLMEQEQLGQEMRRLFAIMGSSANNDPRDDTSLEKRHKKKRRMRDYIKNRPKVIRERLACFVDGQEVDLDMDGYGCDDCDSKNPSIHPGAPELCDKVDNDCNGLVDDGPDCDCTVKTSGGVDFHLCKWRLSWQEASDFCQSKGLKLARIDTDRQSSELWQASQALENNRWWIGATDIAKEGTWTWADGRKVGWSYWGRRQPNNNQCGQDCASLDNAASGRWVDSHCEQNFPFICR